MKSKIKALLAIAGLGLSVAALPAQAHDHDWHGRDDRGHHDGGRYDRRDDYRGRDWRGQEWRGYGGRERYVEARPYWAPRPVYRPYYAPPRAWCPPVYERYPHRGRGDASIVLSVPLF